MYKRLNLLASFAYLRDDPYFQDLLEAVSPYVNILIDSGAHTNHQIRLKKASGKPIKAKEVLLPDYIQYVQRKAHGKVWQYINLDVIRNKNGTDYNLQAMLDAGLRPMPVYIEGHTEQDLNGLLTVNDRLCVAGGVGSSDAYIRRRYKQIFQLSANRAKIHGLGYGRWPGTFYADVASSDSSSFNYGSRYGVMYTYDRLKGFDGLGWKDMDATRTPKDAAVRSFFISLLSYKFNLTVEQLQDVSLYKGKDAQVSLPLLSGCVAYLDFMEHVREYRKDYFIAFPTVGFAETLVAVAAATGMGDTSHKNIKDVFYCIEDARKKSADKGIDTVVSFLEKYTEWQMLPHSL